MFTLNVFWKAIWLPAMANAEMLQVGSLSGSDSSCSECLVTFHKKENQNEVKAAISVGSNS